METPRADAAALFVCPWLIRVATRRSASVREAHPAGGAAAVVDHLVRRGGGGRGGPGAWRGGGAGAGLPHSALYVAAEGPGSHVMVFVPGPVELRERFGAAAGGEQGVSVGFGADGAQDWPWAAVENVYGLGQDVEVLFPQSAQVESDAFEAGHAGVTGRVRLGDIEAGGSEGVIADGGADRKEQPVPARPQRPVAATLFCTL